MLHSDHILLIQYPFPGHIGICTIEETGDFFERWPLSFNEQEPDTQALDNEDCNVHKIELPGEMLEADGIDFALLGSSSIRVSGVTHHIG